MRRCICPYRHHCTVLWLCNCELQLGIVWLIHRPGRETSGLVIVAKDERTKELMQSKWNTLVLEERFEGQHCSLLRIKHLNTGEIIRFISPLQEG